MGNLNGDKLIDSDLSLLTSDLPEVTLTLREPYAMLYSAAKTADGADVTLNWDRNDANSNIRLTSRYQNDKDETSTKQDLDLKVSYIVTVLINVIEKYI